MSECEYPQGDTPEEIESYCVKRDGKCYCWFYQNDCGCGSSRCAWCA